MFIYRAIVLQLFCLLVVMEAEPILQPPDALAPTLCSDWKQAICQICGSVDLVDRCCRVEATYRRCVDSLMYQRPLSVDRSVEPWALGPPSSSSSSASMQAAADKRAKYFLGKRVKYFLGKRSRLQLDDEKSLEDENERPFRLDVEAEKRAKYFLGK